MFISDVITPEIQSVRFFCREHQRRTDYIFPKVLIVCFSKVSFLRYNDTNLLCFNADIYWNEFQFFERSRPR